jgi:hypothetical protein
MEPTAKELISFFYKGNLGKLISSAFNGTMGYINPGHEDSEVLFSFPSENETPEAEEIHMVITESLSALGFIVKDMTGGKNNFHAQILSPQTDEVWVLINISTQYPSRNSHANLRMNCSVHG